MKGAMDFDGKVILFFSLLVFFFVFVFSRCVGLENVGGERRSGMK